jgi:hypothetical protein
MATPSKNLLHLKCYVHNSSMYSNVKFNTFCTPKHTIDLLAECKSSHYFSSETVQEARKSYCSSLCGHGCQNNK